MRKVNWVDWLIFMFCGLILLFMIKSIVGWINTGIVLFSVTSPLVFPFLVLCSMFICWLLTIIGEIKRAIKTEENEEYKKHLNSNIKISGIYALGVLVYTIVIDKIGFLYGSIAFLILGMVFKRRCKLYSCNDRTFRNEGSLSTA